MSDPTPFPTDPTEAEGVDPDLSADDDSRETSDAGAADAADQHPDDRPPTYDEEQRDRLAEAEQNQGDGLTDIP